MSHLSSLSRRGVVRVSSILLVALGLAGLGTAAQAQTKPEPLRIGFQKYGTLTILKARGTLEKRLAAIGVEVKWSEFPAGPQLLEGLNVGAIDVGTVGEAPPIFAQAAGADMVYVANQPPAPHAEAVLVRKDSPLKSLADLRGKKVAVNKGANAHYLLVKALEKAGVPYDAVQTVFLPPADARAAFESGAVDAWAIWDPFYAAAQKQSEARVLADGTGLVSNHQFYIATRSYADKHPQVIGLLVDELVQLDAWAAGKDKEVAAVLAPAIGLSPEIAEVAAGRMGYGIRPISHAVAAEQQKIADTFYALKLIPKPIRVSDALATKQVAER